MLSVDGGSELSKDEAKRNGNASKVVVRIIIAFSRWWWRARGRHNVGRHRRFFYNPVPNRPLAVAMRVPRALSFHSRPVYHPKRDVSSSYAPDRGRASRFAD